MHNRKVLLICVGLLMMMGATACRTQGTSDRPTDSTPTLEQVREYAQRALNQEASSDERQRARESAVQALVKLTRTSPSMRITKDQWEKPLSGSSEPFIHFFDLEQIRVYAIRLPGPGVVPPGERVVIQGIDSLGAVYASELSIVPGGLLVAAQPMGEKGHVSVALVSSLARGGGYVAYYEKDAKSNEFKLNTSVFKGLPSRAGDLTLDVRDNVLMVASPISQLWHPRFEAKPSIRLYFDSDIGIEWIGRFVLLDERNESAFQMLYAAMDSNLNKEERIGRWEKAQHKLPEYFANLESWSVDILAKVPAGATTFRDQQANLAVRIVSIPDPISALTQSLTVIQHRVGEGVPAAQGLVLPGVVEAFHIINRQGLPGLIILSDGSARAGGVSAPKKKVVTLMRLTSGGNWEPAGDWFGFVPTTTDDGWMLRKIPGSEHLDITGRPLDTGTQTVSLTSGPDATVQFCPKPGACFSFGWLNNHLGGSPWLKNKIRELSQSEAQRVTSAQVLAVAHAIELLVAEPEVQQLKTDAIAQMLGKANDVDIRDFDLGEGSGAVGMPPNSLGILPLVIFSRKGTALEVPSPHVIDQWVEARTVEIGSTKWLLALGRSARAAALVLFRWTEGEWVKANALEAPFDELISEQGRVTYLPGSNTPVRGIYARGSENFVAAFTANGKSVSFCEGKQACLTYTYNNGWNLSRKPANQ